MEETGLVFAQDGCQLRPTNGCGATVIQCVCDSELDKLGLEPGESLVEGFGDWKIIAHVGCPTKPSRNDPPARFLRMWEQFKANNGQLSVTKDVIQSQCHAQVQCIGCRRAAESGFEFLAQTTHQSFSPLHVREDGSVAFQGDIGENPRHVYNHLRGYRSFSCQTVVSGKRCLLHRANPQDALEKANEEAWRYMWATIPEEAREVIMDFDEPTVEAAAVKYMKKFCARCRQEVSSAWDILKDMEWFDKPDFLAQTGYDPIVFEGLSYDPEDKVLQVSCDETYLAELITFARKDQKDQERHAEDHIKAQTEVVLIVGHLVHQRMKEMQLRLAQAEQQMQLCYALAASCLWNQLEKDNAESLAAAAARDLLASESSSKSKKKRTKKKKKAESPEQSAVSPVEGSTRQQAIGSCASVTMAATAAPSVEVAVPDEVHDDELKLLEAMGWSNDLNTSLASEDLDVNLSALKEEQLSMRQKIRDDFAKFCAREQAS
eukprot:m.29803 g.29803  ORF g.29803 m.29803 type:complete len:490 (+) comp11977_c0_seq1:248-1717(+)